jgi:UDP-GlcNAc:undecaprenyl-phosphate GlcNAc-1-phosphate transferase
VSVAARTRSPGAVLRRAVAAGAAAATTRASYAWSTRSAGSARWQRTNHRGEPVTLLEGPSVAAGALVGVLVAPGLPPRVRGAAVLAGGAAGLLGGYDDVAGSAGDKGLRGHLGAMASGRLTTGGAKVLGIGAAGLFAGAMARPRRGGVLDAVVAGSVVAGTANLVNLLDLRPGRASKLVLAAGMPCLVMPGVAGDVVAGPVAAAAALLPADLGEEAMLGDAGANALGAMLGVAAAAALPRWALAALSAVIVALTLASERVSFSEVIDRTPPLRAVDRLGRRPVV